MHNSLTQYVKKKGSVGFSTQEAEQKNIFRKKIQKIRFISHFKINKEKMSFDLWSKYIESGSTGYVKVIELSPSLSPSL